MPRGDDTLEPANRRVRSFLSLFLLSTFVLLVLNALLSVYLWAPAADLRSVVRPLPESVGLMLLMWFAALLPRSARTRRRLLVGVGSLLGLLLGFALAEAFFRFYYARAFAPRGDIGMVRGALLLFFGDIGLLATILTPITLALLFLLLAGFGVVLSLLIGSVVRWSSSPESARVSHWAVAVCGASAIVVLLLTGVPASLSERVVLGWFGSGEAFVAVDLASAEQVRVDEDADYVFPGLRDRDIHIFAVEAYGYASVSRPELAAAINPHRERFAAALAGSGYQLRSSYLESPVAGGYSWLAEATLLTGQLINSQERFLRLAEAELPSLTGLLHEGGYYTLTVRPGTVHASWPEGWDLYRFEESIVAHDGDFAFAGPWFSYVPVTDQYAIWTGHKRVAELTAPGGAAEERPLLVYYQLVSSHTPFNAIPPLIDPWEALGDGSVYNERAAEIERFANTWTGGSQLDEGYVAAIGYVFDVLTDYVDRIMDHSRDPVIIVFGDHQPQRPIRSPDAFLSVPIHVASRDEAVMAAFEAIGYEPGMTSSEQPPHLHMKEFFATFAELARGPVMAPGGAPATGSEPPGGG